MGSMEVSVTLNEQMTEKVKQAVKEEYFRTVQQFIRSAVREKLIADGFIQGTTGRERDGGVR